LLADAAVLFAESATVPPLLQETVHGRFWALGLLPGMAWHVLPSGHVEAALGPSLEYFWVWAGDRPGAARFIGGLKGAIGYRQKLLDRWTLSVSAVMGARFGETTVLVGGVPTASLPLFFGGLSLGLAVDLWQRTP
jgi:hypothetical protein